MPQHAGPGMPDLRVPSIGEEAGHLLNYPDHEGLLPPFTMFPWSLVNYTAPYTNTCVG